MVPDADHPQPTVVGPLLQYRTPQRLEAPTPPYRLDPIDTPSFLSTRHLPPVIEFSPSHSPRVLCLPRVFHTPYLDPVSTLYLPNPTPGPRSTSSVDLSDLRHHKTLTRTLKALTTRPPSIRPDPSPVLAVYMTMFDTGLVPGGRLPDVG